MRAALGMAGAPGPKRFIPPIGHNGVKHVTPSQDLIFRGCFTVSRALRMALPPGCAGA